MGVAAFFDTELTEASSMTLLKEQSVEVNSIQQSKPSLQESITENRLKALLKALPAGVIVLDGKGLVQECNPAAIELLDEPLIGVAWYSVINRAFDHSRTSGQDSMTKKARLLVSRPVL
ncbi:PAS domain-containing protein [sulfur-oxidizing endosymbiont of Gigantopelta aegis]|uniref:PAS domain-containing protein n=1 Tax=sulfur-oxidizing endosymbiont of Gigantopelta aegis TaxID=2794934 RepID=UPI0018DC9C9E|nr:PAS domain-containing protein [sulfur-oxidizing endosymbiont of Gigantopelta aegis]